MAKEYIKDGDNLVIRETKEEVTEGKITLAELLEQKAQLEAALADVQALIDKAKELGISE